ncbi:site-specific integrase [Desulfoluna spongiiphila]|nr:site-specific integrase [Desulfoluna spongiiphila]
MAELTDTQIADIIRNHIKQTLEADEHQRIMMAPADYDEGYHRDHTKTLGMVQEITKGHLAVNDRTWVEKSVDGLLNDSGVTIDKSSMEYRKLCREYLKADTHIWEVIQKRHQGDYSDDPTTIPTPPLTVPTPPEDTAPGMLLSELALLYYEEGKREDSWTDKTLDEVSSDIALNIRIIGDIPINTFDHSVANRLKDALLKLPPNINKKPKLKALPIKEILAMEHPEARSTRTVNKGIQRMGMVLKYGVRHGYVEKNYMEGLSLKPKGRKKDKREVFNTADLQAIFGSAKYRNDTFRNAFNFWMPPLALYTGARITELAQLHLEDVKQVDGIWCIDINDDPDDKRLKTQAAKRLVPLHPFLIDDLGIIQRVETMKAQGHHRLFPDINRSRDGYGQTVSKWFGYYRKTIGITGRDKVFHSFRHTVISKLAHNSVDEHIIKAIAGHAENTVTYSVYVKDYPVKRMYEAIVESLRYDVDLDHLKASKYAGTVPSKG